MGGEVFVIGFREFLPGRILDEDPDKVTLS
jgi:hypothetical protein